MTAYLLQVDFYRILTKMQNILRVMSRLSLRTCKPNVKSIALTVLEL